MTRAGSSRSWLARPTGSAPRSTGPVPARLSADLGPRSLSVITLQSCSNTTMTASTELSSCPVAALHAVAHLEPKLVVLGGSGHRRLLQATTKSSALYCIRWARGHEAQLLRKRKALRLLRANRLPHPATKPFSASVTRHASLTTRSVTLSICFCQLHKGTEIRQHAYCFWEVRS